jgi:hypothetical protein
MPRLAFDSPQSINFLLKILRKKAPIFLLQRLQLPIIFSNGVAAAILMATAVHFKSDVTAHRLGKHHAIIKSNFLPIMDGSHGFQKDLAFESTVRLTTVIKEIGWFRFDSASPAKHESLLNLHRILPESDGKVIDFIDGHDISTEYRNSLPFRDLRPGKNTIAVDARLSNLQLRAQPTTFPFYSGRIHCVHYLDSQLGQAWRNAIEGVLTGMSTLTLRCQLVL